jgi:hypothetical protein
VGHDFDLVLLIGSIAPVQAGGGGQAEALGSSCDHEAQYKLHRL